MVFVQPLVPETQINWERAGCVRFLRRWRPAWSACVFFPNNEKTLLAVLNPPDIATLNTRKIPPEKIIPPS